MSNRLCLYHGNCSDGFAAACVVWLRFAGDVELKPCSYGDEEINPETLRDREVYIVDFSFQRGLLEKMHVAAKSLVVIDHHTTAKDNLEGLSYCVFDMNHSGAVLTWKYFWPEITVPELLLYVEDRDLWKFELEDSREISAYLHTLEHVPELWVYHLTLPEKNLFRERGTGATEYLAYYSRSVGGNAMETVLGEDDVVLVNAPTSGISDLLDYLLEGDGPQVAIGWRVTKSGYSFSVRSRGVDSQHISQRYGGGGHKQASGFELPYEEGAKLISELLKEASR